MQLDFKTCPKCNGYGILDNGKHCRTCGGSDQSIGSGEVMFKKGTHERVTAKQLARHILKSRAAETNEGTK